MRKFTFPLVRPISKHGLTILPILAHNNSPVLHYSWVQSLSLTVISSVQFSRSVVSDSLRPHELQHARPPCPSPTPGACSNSYPLSWWCHPTMSSSVVPFSSRLQSFPASGFFPMSQFFASSSQSIGVSASVLPMNIQDWFSLGWTGVSLWSRRDSQESPVYVWRRVQHAWGWCMGMTQRDVVG